MDRHWYHSVIHLCHRRLAAVNTPWRTYLDGDTAQSLDARRTSSHPDSVKFIDGVLVGVSLLTEHGSHVRLVGIHSNLMVDNGGVRLVCQTSPLEPASFGTELQNLNTESFY